MPDIFGGNGAFGQPGYFAHYNLAEVTGYAASLALIATLRVPRASSRDADGRVQDRDYVLYFVVLGVVGLLRDLG